MKSQSVTISRDLWESTVNAAKIAQARIVELEDAIRNTRGLLDTGFAPENWGMMPQEWAVHKITKASAELQDALEKSNVPNLSA